MIEIIAFSLPCLWAKYLSLRQLHKAHEASISCHIVCENRWHIMKSGNLSGCKNHWQVRHFQTSQFACTPACTFWRTDMRDDMEWLTLYERKANCSEGSWPGLGCLSQPTISCKIRSWEKDLQSRPCESGCPAKLLKTTTTAEVGMQCFMA